MRVIAAACVIVAGFTTNARADWEYTKWGMTPEQVASASMGTVKLVPQRARFINEDDGWEIAAKGKYSAGPLTLDVGFIFDVQTGGLKCALYNANGAQATLLKETLTTRYGPPESRQSFIGAETLTWTKPDNIELTMGQKPVAAIVEHCAR